MRIGLKAKAALVALGVFIVSLAGIPARATYGAQTSADEPQYLMTALSIAEDGDLDISNQRYSGAYRDFHEVLLPVQTVLHPDGSRVSPHSPLLPLYLALPMRAGGWMGAKAALAALAGVLAGLLVWVGAARLRVRFGVATAVAIVLSLSPPLAMYATQVYPEVAAALMVTIAFAALTGRRNRSTAAALGVGVVALPWLAVKYIPIAAALAAAGAWRLRRRPPLLAGLLVALAAAGSAYLVFNQTVYGGWTPYASGDFFAVGGEFTALGPSPDYWGRSQRLLGLWVDRGFGLVAWQPAYLMVFPAVAWAAGSGAPHRALLLGVAGAGWLVATFLAQTMHGWWWPGRQTVAILPALILPLMMWIDRVPRLRTPFLAIGATGVAAFLWLAVEATVGRATLIVDFTSTSNPFYRAWRLLLPDYLNPNGRTWVLHAFWLIGFGGLAVYGWLTGARERRAKSEPESTIGRSSATAQRP